MLHKLYMLQNNSILQTIGNCVIGLQDALCSAMEVQVFTLVGSQGDTG